MARKNKRARKVWKVNYGRFAKTIGLTPIQRIKTAKLIEQIVKGGAEVK